MIFQTRTDTGLPAKTIKAICAVFARYPEIDKAILYGSRAKGTYGRGSDIDLTLEGNLLTLTLLHRIDTEIDDLLLPYQTDLSIRHTIENKALQEHIGRVGKVVYEKS